MKKGSFSGLLYREWALLKKHLIINLISVSSIITLTLLILLSFRYGNLALLDDSLKATITEGLAFPIKLFPVVMICIMVWVPSQSAIYDVKLTWERFRRTTPVSCFRLAFVKYTMIAVVVMLSAGAVLGVTALLCAAMNAVVTVEDIAVAMAIHVFCTLLGVLMQVFVTFFKSQDKAGLAITGLLVICVIPIVFGASQTGQDLMNKLTGVCVDVIPFVPFVQIAILAFGLFATTMIYKRREK